MRNAVGAPPDRASLTASRLCDLHVASLPRKLTEVRVRMRDLNGRRDAQEGGGFLSRLRS
jgi:hypothetical protein